MWGRGGRCCGWRRDAHGGACCINHRHPAAVAGGARLGGGRHLLQAPRTADVRGARGSERAPRQPGNRMGPAAARAERLGYPCLRRARRQRQTPHGDAACEGHRDRRPMKLRSARDAAPASFRWRAHLLQGLLGVSALALAWRAVNLQLVDHGFLAREGDARFSRVLDIAAHRGTITDRYGEPLAVSTPVDSVWVNPRELALATDQIPRLASALQLDRQELARRVTSNLEREFLYLARHLQPAEAAQINALGIPVGYTSREYRRYYPAGEVTGHLLGFTNVDDAGQEGLELAFDHWLPGAAA